MVVQNNQIDNQILCNHIKEEVCKIQSRRRMQFEPIIKLSENISKFIEEFFKKLARNYYNFHINYKPTKYKKILQIPFLFQIRTFQKNYYKKQLLFQTLL